MIFEAAHLNRYEAWLVAVMAIHAASAFRAKITSHLIPTVYHDGVSGCFSQDGDILFGEVCIGRVASAGSFLTIKTMALHHHPGLFTNGQGDSTTTTTTSSKWPVGHIEFPLNRNRLTYFDAICLELTSSRFSLSRQTV